jgi:hypothetical protein
VPHPDSSRLREHELGQKAPVNRRAARRPGRTAQVVRARELDRESVQSDAGGAQRGSKRRLGVLGQPTNSIHTDSIPARIRHQIAISRLRAADTIVVLPAHQNVLNQVRSGRRNAVHVFEGKRRGVGIEIHARA